MRSALLALVLTACAPTLREARAVQPNPVAALGSKDTIPVSVPLFVYQKDSRIGWNYQLRDSAQFSVVNRDRLRFRIGVVARDESDADTKDAKVWLVDSNGQRHDPEGREAGRMNRISVNIRPLPLRPAGNPCANPPCYDILGPDAFEVYEGQSDYMFHEDGLAEKLQGFTLFVVNGSSEYRYTWRYADGEEIHNYGRSQADVSNGVVEIPGPLVKVIASRAEGDAW